MAPTFSPLMSGLNQPSGYGDYAAIGAFSIALGTYLLKGKTWDRPDPYHEKWFEKPQLADAAINGKRKQTRDISKKMEEMGHEMVIFWGSQSGTAEGFANRLARESHTRFQINCMAADLSDFDSESIAKISRDKLAIFIMSTFGEGDPSDNTAGLWQWIHTTSVPLGSLRYFAFGLGNSNYKCYNKVIDVVVEKLDKLGAQCLIPVGKADDAKGATEEDFIAWKETLFNHFRQSLGYQECDVIYQPSLLIQEDESLEPIDLHQGEPVVDVKSSAGASAVEALPIKEVRELFSSSAKRNCLHAELDLSGFPELTYKTGDHLSIWPSNPGSEVERLLKQLGRLDSADIPISMKSLDGSKVLVPSPTTLSVLFRYYVEICAPVSREAVAQLAQFAPTKESALFLEGIAADRSKYADFLSENHITLGRLLELATASWPRVWAEIPLSFIVEILPVMKPRHYSISSSSTVSPRAPTITAVVSQTPLQSSSPSSSSTSETQVTIPGLATNYLLAHHHRNANLDPNANIHTYTLDLPNSDNNNNNTADPRPNKIFAQIRKSKFKLPTLSSRPIIMIAAGTGLAPFRAFIQERARLKQMNKPCGKMLLFYGCRHPEQDYLYKEELVALRGVLGGDLEIFEAFSRIEEDGKEEDGMRKRAYVQDLVERERDKVLGLLVEGDANVYLCGSAAMARDVGRVIYRIMKEGNGWSEEETRGWSEMKKRTRKFQEDVWG